jgi:hypothetical protein
VVVNMLVMMWVGAVVKGEQLLLVKEGVTSKLVVVNPSLGLASTLQLAGSRG